MIIKPAADQLDAASAALVAGQLGALDPASDVVVDLSEVSFCDSSGLKVLVTAQQRHAGAGGSLRLDRPNHLLRRLLSVCGLDTMFGVEVET